MLQVIQEIVKNPEDNTEATFIFANKTEQDIILKKELDEMAAKSDKLNVSICLLLDALHLIYQAFRLG